MEIRNKTIIDIGELGQIVKAGLESVGYKITGGITVSVSRGEVGYTPWGPMYVVVTAQNPPVDTVDLGAIATACAAAIHEALLTCKEYELRDVILTAESLGITRKVLRRVYSRLCPKIEELVDRKPTAEMLGYRVGLIREIQDDDGWSSAVSVKVFVTPPEVRHDEACNVAKPKRKKSAKRKPAKRK